MKSQDKKIGWYEKVSHVVIQSYVLNIVFFAFALDGRLWWVGKHFNWFRGRSEFFISALGIVINAILACNCMKKLIKSGRCKHPVRDCIVVIVPIVLAVLSMILDLILIK